MFSDRETARILKMFRLNPIEPKLDKNIFSWM